jgi:hypothetical protein|nr:hypothetical protein [Neorhizobium tomejilense]
MTDSTPHEVHEEPGPENDWLLTDEELEYLHGKCHLLAIALHDITGFPMRAYLDTAWVEKGDEEIEMVVLVHAFVVDGEEAIDVRGRVPLDDVLGDYFEIATEEWIVEPTEEDLFKLGEGRHRVSKNGERYLAAYRMAESLVEKLQFLPSRSSGVGPAP